MTTLRSRLAPSPTGSLHLGNASTFLYNWAIAKSKGWELIMRVEDIDGPRKHIDTIQETFDVLSWLGIEWDGEARIQSRDLVPCRDALDTLIRLHRAYHCNLTRAELAAVTSAPHADDDHSAHAARPDDVPIHNAAFDDGETNWRFVMQDTPLVIEDQFAGSQTFQPADDFVVWTRKNSPSYQLAVVVDDHIQGVTDVVRGNDLLESAAWQEQLYNALGWEPPRWWHVPLVVGNDGKRLAKRHGDSRIASYRAHGVDPERIIGLIAMWYGLQQDRFPMTSEAFCSNFSFTKIPHENIVFSEEDEQWLLA